MRKSVTGGWTWRVGYSQAPLPAPVHSSLLRDCRGDVDQLPNSWAPTVNTLSLPSSHDTLCLLKLRPKKSLFPKVASFKVFQITNTGRGGGREGWRDRGREAGKGTSPLSRQGKSESSCLGFLSARIQASQWVRIVVWRVGEEGPSEEPAFSRETSMVCRGSVASKEAMF